MDGTLDGFLYYLGGDHLYVSILVTMVCVWLIATAYDRSKVVGAISLIVVPSLVAIIFFRPLLKMHSINFGWLGQLKEKVNLGWLFSAEVLIPVGIFVCGWIVSRVFLWKYVRSNRRAFILMSLLTAVWIWQSNLWDIWNGFSFGFSISNPIGIFVALLMVASGIWRHSKVIKPKSWNVDPEAEGEDKNKPQVHWFGVWSNILTHLFLAFVAITWKHLLYEWETPAFAVVLVYGILIAATWYRARHDNEEDDTDGSFEILVKDPKSIGDYKNVIWLIVVALAVATLLGNVSSFVHVFPTLYVLIVLGGTYTPHIRARLIPVFFRWLWLSKLLMLGRRYLDNGIHPTLAASWFVGHNVLDVDRATWEVQKIESPEIPTLKEDPATGETLPGTPVIVAGKPTIRTYNPKYWFILSDDDRGPEKIRGLVEGYVIGALQSITKKLTYSQCKMKGFYEYSIRRRDLLMELQILNAQLQDLEARRVSGLLSLADYNAAKLLWDADKATWDARELEYKGTFAKMEIKVKWIRKEAGRIVAWGPYVTEDKPGVYMSATFFEFLDWVLLVLTGSRLMKFDVTDVTNEDIEEAEKKIEIAERYQQEAKALADAGADEGRRLGAARKAEIEQLAAVDPIAYDRMLALKAAEGASIHKFLEKLGR